MSLSPASPELSGASFTRRRWCVGVALGLLVLGAVLNLVYLFNHSPIDLSEDEAHYWQWSQRLDYGYYSKPPGIAWVIAGAVEVGRALHLTGDESGAALMPVVRMPAIVFGFFSGLLSFLLARRMFRDDRAGLAVIVLSAAVPMFAVGSLLITIDSPMYLCWAATVACLWRAVEGNAECAMRNAKGGTRWLYLAGVACAVGMLFKPVLIAIPMCAAIGAWADPAMRRAFKTRHSVGALFIVGLSQVPVVVWNANHHWVTFRHILTQGGMGAQAGETKSAWYAPVARIGEYAGGQAGGMGGIMFALLVIAVIVAFQKLREAHPAATITEQRPLFTVYAFLLSFTLPLWGFYFLLNVIKRTEVNWPAASYFSGMILLAGVFTECWNSVAARERRAWRVWGSIAVIWGVVITAAALNFHRAYPWIAEKLQSRLNANGEATEAYYKSWFHPLKWDQPTVRLRGLQDRARIVERAREALRAETGKEPLLITSRYDTSSSLAFYLPGHPFVFSVMSSVGGRQSQFDIWPGLNERDAAGALEFAGRPAVIVGSFEPWAVEDVLRKSFERLEGPTKETIEYEGVWLKDVILWRGYGFKGVPPAAGAGTSF